jgi:hypothetical protein
MTLSPSTNFVKKTGYSPTLIFEYNAMSTALRAARPQQNTQMEVTEPANVEQIITAKQFRLILTAAKSTEPCSVKFWQHKYNITIEKKHWVLARLCTKEERLRLLQWKILHNIYPTNILLNKMKIKDSNKCNYCDNTDFIEHFFWGCGQIKSFWNYVEAQIDTYTGKQVSLTERDVLFGHQLESVCHTNKLINHILLIAKMCISKFKYGNNHNLETTFNREIHLRQKYLKK